MGTTNRPPSPLWMTSPGAAVAAPGRTKCCKLFLNDSSMIPDPPNSDFTTELTLKSHLTRDTSESHAKSAKSLYQLPHDEILAQPGNGALDRLPFQPKLVGIIW